MRSTPRRELIRTLEWRRVWPALVFTLGSALMWGCPALPDGPRYRGAGSEVPRRGGTLMLYEEARVQTLDPATAHDVLSSVVIRLIFDSLYEYDHDMRLVPRIARELPRISPDGLVYTVPLRRGVRFHHGREVTAEDAVWSIERMLSPELASPATEFYSALEGYEEFRAKRVSHLRGLRVLDRYTFEARLSRPDQSFVHMLAMHFAAPVPRERASGHAREFREHPVGTGPFVFDVWDPGVRIVVRRNPRYFRVGLPYLDRVVFEESISRETGFLRFRNGEEDIAPRVSAPDRALLLTAPKWRPYTRLSPSIDVWGLVMNCDMPPFDDVHVRRAVAFAIDRERWSLARNRGLLPAGQMVPPKLAGYDPNLPNLQHFDLGAAKAEMRRAGHPNGLEEPVTMWVSDTPTGRAYGSLAQADLAKIGIKLELKMVSFPVWLSATSTEKTVQMYAGGWVMDYPDPSNFLGLLHSRGIAKKSSLNRAFYRNTELDELLDAAIVERDVIKRAALYREANDLVAREAPWAVFANAATPQAWQPYVKNYRPHPAYWLPVNEVWLDLPKRRIARAPVREQLGRLATLPPLRIAP